MYYQVLAAKNPSIKIHAWVKDLFTVIGASLIISLFAHVSIPLPFTPVPLALQSSVILFMGAYLGSRRGTLAVLLFIIEGIIGLPVFAGGKAGMMVLFGTTGGYIIGYAVAAFLVGWIMERAKERTVKRSFIAVALGSLAIYLFGWAWLSLLIGAKSAFLLGVCPFVVGDFLKAILAVKGLKAVSIRFKAI